MKKGVVFKNRHVVRLIGVVSGLFVLVATSFIPADMASAGTTSTPSVAGPVEWVNRNTVVSGKRYFVDSNPSDANAEFVGTFPGSYGICPVKIRFTMPEKSNSSRGQIVLNDGDASNVFYYGDDTLSRTAKFIEPTGDKDLGDNYLCNDERPATTVTVSKTENRRVTFIQTDSKTIVNYKNLIKFSQNASDPSMFRRTDETGDCRDIIYMTRPYWNGLNGEGDNIWSNTNTPVPNPGGTVRSAALFAVRNDSGAREAESYAKLFNIKRYCPIDNPDLYSPNVFGAVSDSSGDDGSKVVDFIANGVGPGGSRETANNSYDDTFIVYVGDTNNLVKDANGKPILPTPAGITLNNQTCKGGALGWVVCPIVSAIAGISQVIRDAMQSMLRVNPLPLDSTTPEFTIWENLRNFSNILFVIVFMIVIFSQATSIGLSSYGIKSLLPRLIAVAILSNISYYLGSFIIDVFNILGVGIQNLFAIANGGNSGTVDISNGAGTIVLGGTVLAIGASIYTGAIVQLFPLLVAAFISALIVFIVLVIRQALIILVVVASPIILVLSILPGTRQYATGTFNMFIGLMVMYPLIMGLFAAARLASAILTSL